jgi:hypothetical protein
LPLWDITAGKELRRFEEHTESPHSVVRDHLRLPGRPRSRRTVGGKVFAKLFATLFPGGRHLWRTQDDK